MRIKLNGKKIKVADNKTIYEICKDNEITIPTLCRQDGICPKGRCRICLIEMDDKLVTSCSTKPREGCEIVTHSDRAKDARKMNLELIMAGHKEGGLPPEEYKEIHKLVKEVGLKDFRFKRKKNYIPSLGSAVIRDNNKCINCGRCVDTCREIQGCNAIDFAGRGFSTHVASYSENSLNKASCIKCGQCIINCPVGALYERNQISEVVQMINDPRKHVVVQTAPSIRVSLGELFGYKPGRNVEGQMVAALKACGFDQIFDVDLGADFTIMEEASEFIKRVQNNGPFPMITSCCPGWVLFAEKFYPKLLKNLSSSKSPNEMLGALVKSYYSKKMKIPKKDIVVVAAMPCTAKKFEANRVELENNIDYVLTTREIAKLIKQCGIDFKKIKKRNFDSPLGISTGAGTIFGVTGGVMEAALRSAFAFATGKNLKSPTLNVSRGMDGVKTGKIKIGDNEFKLAVANGGKNIHEVLKNYKDYHFIEIMACPGGCIGGGGQPIPTTDEIRRKRAAALYTDDAKDKLRNSHDNPVIKKVYKEFLGKPLSPTAEKLLHTTFKKKSKY